MATVSCSHGIARCDMRPVDINMVECRLTSTIRGEVPGGVAVATMKFNPSIIQSWIYGLTYLKCFNFSVGFEDLSVEVKKFNEEHGKKIPTKLWDERFAKAIERASVELASYDNAKDHKYVLAYLGEEAKGTVKLTCGC